jgi:hypothetical protein
MSDIDWIAEHLRTLDLRFDRPGNDLITAGFSRANTSFFLRVFGQKPLYTFFVPAIAGVPEGRVPEVLRLINAINARRLRWGAFWLGDDRHLAFEGALIAPDGPSLEGVVVALHGLDAIDAFYPAVMRVCWAAATAEEALAALPSRRPPADEDEPTLELVI